MPSKSFIDKILGRTEDWSEGRVIHLMDQTDFKEDWLPANGTGFLEFGPGGRLVAVGYCDGLNVDREVPDPTNCEPQPPRKEPFVWTRMPNGNIRIAVNLTCSWQANLF